MLSKRSIRRLFWGCLILWGILIALQLIHLSTPVHITDTNGESTVEITIQPGTIHFPNQDVQVRWELDGIQSVHIDGQGTIGAGDTTFVADACNALAFNVVYSDGTEASFHAQPRLSITDPVTILLVILGIGVLLLAGHAYRIPIATPVSDSLFQLPATLADFKQSRILWKWLLLLGVVLPVIYSTIPLCNGQNLVNFGFDTFQMAGFYLPIIISLFLFIFSIIRNEVFYYGIRQWVYRTPQPIVITIVIIWWGLVFSQIAKWAYQLPVVPVLITGAWFALVGFTIVLVNATSPNRRALFANLTRERLTQHRVPILIIGLVLGLLLWFTPWQMFIAYTWLQMLIGVALFVLPGLFVQQWFHRQQAWSLSRAISLGFVLSVTMTALLGFVSNLLGLSMTAVQAGLFIIGFLAFVALLWDGQWSLPPTKTEYPRLVAGLMLIAIMAMLFISRMPFAHFAYNTAFTGDYHSQTAYATYFSEAEPYAYQEVFLGTDTPTPPRFWFFYWSLSHALIDQLANTHASVSVLILGSFTAIIAFISSYALARRLGLNRIMAWLVILVQIASFALTLENFEVGQVFVQWTAIDKGILTFIFTPVVLSLLLGWLAKPTRRTFSLLCLAIIGMPFTHPVMTAVTVLVCGFILLFDTLVTRRIKIQLLALLDLGIAVALPFTNLLLASQSNSALNEMITVGPDFSVAPDFHRDLLIVSDNGQYRIATHLVDALPFVLAIVSLGILLIRTPRAISTRFALATLIPLGIVLFPPTASVLGRAITPFQLWRVPWIVPLGVVILLGYHQLQQRLPQQGRQVLIALIALGCLAITITGFQQSVWAIADIESAREDNADRPIRVQQVYANMGRYLAEHAQDNALIIGDPILASWIPTLSGNSAGLIFRSPQNMTGHAGIPLDESQARYDAYLQFFQSDDDQARIDILNTYDVDYLIISRNQPTIHDFANRYDAVEEVDTFGIYTLYAVTSP